MITRLLAVIGIVAAASAVASCEQAAAAVYKKWKCFSVNMVTQQAPHLENGDQYCVVTRNDAWYLDPGMGMSNWKPIGGGSRIPLLITEDTDLSKTWKFEVFVTDHDTLPPSDHMGQHRAARGYSLNVIVPADPSVKAEANISVLGPPDDTVHDGAAHANED